MSNKEAEKAQFWEKVAAVERAAKLPASEAHALQAIELMFETMALVVTGDYYTTNEKVVAVGRLLRVIGQFQTRVCADDVPAVRG